MAARRRCRWWWLVAAFCGAALAGEDWPPEDLPDNPFQVGGGELRFLPADADDGWLHSHKRLTVSAQSLTDGWVDMEQCYTNLDAIAAVEVVYRYRDIRNLAVDEHSGIGEARAGERSISLASVEQGARLCARAQVRILQPAGGDRYVMHNGPFHRRFLDGYFPMRVTLEVLFPVDRLDFTAAEPKSQPGFALTHEPGHVHIDSRFTGLLELTLHFRAAGRHVPQ